MARAAWRSLTFVLYGWWLCGGFAVVLATHPVARLNSVQMQTTLIRPR